MITGFLQIAPRSRSRNVHTTSRESRKVPFDALGGVLAEPLAAEEKSRAGGSKGVEDGGPTSADLAAEENEFLSRVVTEEGSREWKEYSVGRFEVRCFAVEWKGSALLDKKKFLKGLYRAIGRGVEVSRGRDGGTEVTGGLLRRDSAGGTGAMAGLEETADVRTRNGRRRGRGRGRIVHEGTGAAARECGRHGGVCDGDGGEM